MATKTQEALARLATFAPHNPNPVIETDLRGRVTYLNPVAQTQLPELEAAGLDHPLLVGLRQVIAQMERGGEETLVREVQVGDSVYEQKIVYLPDSGLVRIYANDLTERKRAEQTLRLQSTALASAANAIMITDREGRITWVNPAFVQLSGYSTEGIVGQNPRFLKSGQHTAAFYRNLWSTILAGRVWQGEITNRRKDGSLYTEEMTITPVHDAGDEISHFIAIKQDITARKQAEAELALYREHLEDLVAERTKELQQEIADRVRAEEALEAERASLARRVAERTAELSAANAELARASRLKDEFLANMSHELRTPLNAILGLSEGLQEEVYGPLTERQARSLKTIEDSGRHLLSLINDILDVSKIEAGKLELQIDDIPVETLCQASLGLVKQAAHKKRLKVSSTLDSTVTTIQADQRRLKQVLVNLLANAVKFTPEGGAIGLEVVGDEEKEVVHLAVWDTGIGISPEDMRLIFQPFVQLDSKLSRQHAGTGLGLALVRRLTEMHGGGIAVESKAGQGSRFTVSLPWRPPGAVAESTEDGQIGPLSAPAIGGVLIIEDSPTAADQVGRYLSELGAEPRIHPQGQEAVEQAQKIRPDLIILDILLPDISGWQVLKQLKENRQTQDIPVLIISIVDERAKALAMGAAESLVKPVSRPDLYQGLRKALHPAAEAQASMPTTVEPEHPAIKLLLAEDNEQNIHTVSDYLLARGYSVIVARNGAEALERAKEELPDLILVDIQMPVMNGLEATRRIRADVDPATGDKTELADVPIIALTALAMPGDRERCLQAGVDEHLSKPVSMKHLVYVIEQQLNRARQREEE